MRHLLLAALAVIFNQSTCRYVIFWLCRYATPQLPNVPHFFRQTDDEMLAEMAESIPGEPGVDYPIYSQPPVTDFDCAGKVKAFSDTLS